MATVKMGDSEVEVQDGELIRDAAEQLGVPFGCKNGICGTCMVDVEEGQENLSELTPEEEDMGRDREHRLACQAKIKEGTVTIKF